MAELVLTAVRRPLKAYMASIHGDGHIGMLLDLPVAHDVVTTTSVRSMTMKVAERRNVTECTFKAVILWCRLRTMMEHTERCFSERRYMIPHRLVRADVMKRSKISAPKSITRHRDDVNLR
jgi:hypothetical protein